MVPYAACGSAWGSPEGSGSKTWGTWALARCLDERIALYVYIDGSARAFSVGACPCLASILSDLRETSGPRIDRIQSARPSWRDRQYRELKKVFFFAPSKCRIDLSGPWANRTLRKRLHGAALRISDAVMRVPRRGTIPRRCVDQREDGVKSSEPSTPTPSTRRVRRGTAPGWLPTASCRGDRSESGLTGRRRPWGVVTDKLCDCG